MVTELTPPPQPVDPKPTRRQHITREEEADRCLNHTTFTPGSRAMIVAFFLLVVFGVPLLQHVYEIRKNLDARAHWTAGSGQPEPQLAPQIYDVFKLLPTLSQIKEAKGFWGYWSLIPSGESISAFETSLKENSVLSKKLLSPTQEVLTGVFGAGNEKAYVGKWNTLFYRPDVEYLTSGPFLDPERLKALTRGTTPIQPDPVKAILDFRRQLFDHGVNLVVMPVPTKPMVDPENLIGTGGVFQNPSFGEFCERLKSAGITIFDPTLDIQRSTDQAPKYLATDTHWKPRAMEMSAASLATLLDTKFKLPQVEDPQYISKPEKIENIGDIAEMLKLPKDQTIFEKQAVTINRIFQTDGQPWTSNRKSDVLLLGDSFSNIYSLEGMGWGANAGFAEQLSYYLQRPVDKIAINAGGAYASRRELARQSARGVDRLAGKRVVVLEFSMRDLEQGDWKLIQMPERSLAQPAMPWPSATPSGSKSNGSANPGSKDPGLIAGTPPGSAAAKPQSLSTNVPGALGTTKPAQPTPNTTKPIVPGKPANVTQVRKQSKPVTQPTPSATKSTTTKPANPPVANQDGLIVTGRIAARAATPKPGSVPYKDCVIALQLTDLQVSGGSIKGPNIVVYVWGMRDNRLVDGAYAVGQTHKFKLTPWASVDSKYGGYNRQELDSDDSLSWAAFWGEVSK